MQTFEFQLVPTVSGTRILAWVFGVLGYLWAAAVLVGTLPWAFLGALLLLCGFGVMRWRRYRRSRVSARATLDDTRLVVRGEPIAALDLALGDLANFTTLRMNGAAISLTTRTGQRHHLASTEWADWKGLAELAGALQARLPQLRSRSVFGSKGMGLFCSIATAGIVGAVAYGVLIAGVESWGGLALALSMVPVLWGVYFGSK